jgi:hypothetical protein
LFIPESNLGLQAMPKLPKKKTQNNAFKLLSKKFIHDASHLNQEILKQQIIEGWRLDRDEIVPPVLALLREMVLQAAWLDFLAMMQLILVDIGTVAAASTEYKNNITYPFGKELCFYFNATGVLFEPSLNAEFSQYLDLSILNYETDPRHPAPGKIYLFGTPLLAAIANTHAEIAIDLINDGTDINKYSHHFGNNPILLAFSKGYHHVQSEPEDDETASLSNQEQIIQALLIRKECDINAVHLFNGMTVMHIVCIRGDDPAVIELLIQRGAQLDSKDCKGKTPADYLNLNYQRVQEIVNQLTGGHQRLGEYNNPPNKSMTATIPTEAERNRNIILIKKIFGRIAHENTATDPGAVKRAKR